jgi:hypothetical protein
LARGNFEKQLKKYNEPKNGVLMEKNVNGSSSSDLLLSEQ